MYNHSISLFYIINIFRSTVLIITHRINTPLPFLVFSSLHTKQQPRPQQQLFDAVKVVQNVDEAHTLFNHMLKLKPRPSVSHFHRLLTTILKLKHYPLVVVLFKKLFLYRYPVNPYFMATIINCYGKLNQVGFSFPVIASFLKRGFAPNIVCFNSLIKGLFLQQDGDKAISLFRSLVRRKFEISEFTLAIVVDGLCKSGDVAGAGQLLEIAEKKDWKLGVQAYSSMMDGLCKCGMLKEAMMLFTRMIDRNIVPDVYTYTLFIHGLCNHDRLDFACSIFSDLPSKGVYPNLVTYTVIIQGLCRGGHFQIAKDILENMERVGFVADGITCNVVLKECLLRRPNSDSINLLKQVVGRDFQLSASTFFVLLRRIPKMRQMGYGSDVINHLMLKLTSSDCIHEIDGDVSVNSLIQKLY